MKTAEDIAEEITDWLKGSCAHVPEGRCLKCQNQGISHALTKFAEERVKEALDRDDHLVFESGRIEGREEALEQAAKVAEDNGFEDIGELIRALKNKL